MGHILAASHPDLPAEKSPQQTSGDLMKLIHCSIAILTLTAGMTSVSVLADEHHDDHGYVRHEEWKKGAKMRDEDWHRGEHIDYKEHHLRAPPHGYEWRSVDGNYVLAAAATGVIASVIAASEAHH
jgi:Ni/Co efflux regulator RcnB